MQDFYIIGSLKLVYILFQNDKEELESYFCKRYIRRLLKNMFALNNLPVKSNI